MSRSRVVKCIICGLYHPDKDCDPVRLDRIDRAHRFASLEAPVDNHGRKEYMQNLFEQALHEMTEDR